MLNFCPKCGEKVIPDAAFCVHCGFRISADSSIAVEPIRKHEAAPGEGEHPAIPPAGQKGGLFDPVRFLRRSPSSETATVETKVRRTPVRPVLFYGFMSLILIGLAGAVWLPMVQGRPSIGREINSLASAVGFSAYLIARRHGYKRMFAFIYGIIGFVVTFALIGMSDGFVNRDRYQWDKTFLENPMLAALKDADRKAYDELLVRVVRSTRDSKDNDSLRSILRTKIGPVLNRYLFRTTDEALVNFYQMKVRQLNLLRSVRPQLCYQAGIGSYTPVPSADIPPNSIRDAQDAMAIVIRAGNGQSEQAINKASAQASIDMAYTIAERQLGAEAHLMALVNDPKAQEDYPGACKAVIALYQSILVLPPADAANVFRSFWAQP